MVPTSRGKPVGRHLAPPSILDSRVFFEAGQPTWSRALNCAYLSAGGDEQRNYDDMGKFEQRIVDQLDCDVPGR